VKGAAMKISKPEKAGTSWRICRHDGELVGYYATKVLAQKAIDVSFYLK
jgi:hypothetical protein